MHFVHKCVHVTAVEHLHVMHHSIVMTTRLLVNSPDGADCQAYGVQTIALWYYAWQLQAKRRICRSRDISAAFYMELVVECNGDVCGLCDS